MMTLLFRTAPLRNLVGALSCEARPQLRSADYPRMTQQRFDSLSEAEMWDNFRFYRADFSRLQALFKFPDVIHIPRHGHFTGLEAMCVLLRRLRYPSTLSLLVPFFGRREQQLSALFHFALIFIDNKYRHLLENLALWSNRAPAYQQSIVNKGSPYANIIGFLDATINRCCKPIRNQREYYTGWKKKHGLKWQALHFPDGMTGHLFGPVPTRQNDPRVLQLSGILQQWALHLPAYVMYADKGYPWTQYIQIGWPQYYVPTAAMMAFNRVMAAFRIVVEWGFHDVSSLWPFVDFVPQQKVLLQPLGRTYRVAVILKNCHVCIHGGTTAQYYSCDPPGLEEYLGW
jgi:hypothetical protein